MSRFGGPWSEPKLQCVEDYACAYLRVMQNQSRFELHYVDAFSGSGRQEVKRGGRGPSHEVGFVNEFFGDEEDAQDVLSSSRGRRCGP
jgi:three-Cys-motif partner protein